MLKPKVARGGEGEEMRGGGGLATGGTCCDVGDKIRGEVRRCFPSTQKKTLPRTNIKMKIKGSAFSACAQGYIHIYLLMRAFTAKRERAGARAGERLGMPGG